MPNEPFTVETLRQVLRDLPGDMRILLDDYGDYRPLMTVSQRLAPTQELILTPYDGED